MSENDEEYDDERKEDDGESGSEDGSLFESLEEVFRKLVGGEAADQFSDLSLGHYILGGADGHDCIPVSFWEWAQWFETSDRTVLKTYITPALLVSTVFLGIDHSFGLVELKGPFHEPILFETMVFRFARTDGLVSAVRWIGGEQKRYATWEEAEAGHREFVDGFDLRQERLTYVFAKFREELLALGAAIGQAFRSVALFEEAMEQVEKMVPKRRKFNWRRWLFRWFGWFEKRKLSMEAKQRMAHFLSEGAKDNGNDQEPKR